MNIKELELWYIKIRFLSHIIEYLVDENFDDTTQDGLWTWEYYDDEKPKLIKELGI